MFRYPGSKSYSNYISFKYALCRQISLILPLYNFLIPRNNQDKFNELTPSTRTMMTFTLNRVLLKL